MLMLKLDHLFVNDEVVNYSRFRLGQLPFYSFFSSSHQRQGFEFFGLRIRPSSFAKRFWMWFPVTYLLFIWQCITRIVSSYKFLSSFSLWCFKLPCLFLFVPFALLSCAYEYFRVCVSCAFSVVFLIRETIRMYNKIPMFIYSRYVARSQKQSLEAGSKTP